MRRWGLNILAALSLLLCAGAIILWPLSYRTPRVLRYRHQYAEYPPLRLQTAFIVSGQGRIEVGFAKEHFYLANHAALPLGLTYASDPSVSHPGTAPIALGWQRQLLGFGIVKDWQQQPNINTHMLNMSTIFAGGVRLPWTRFGWTEWLWGVWVPHWAVVLATGVLPARRFYRLFRSWRRRVGGLCLKCGYDLRASGGRCPECGASVLGTTGEALVPRT